jgi:Tol biopolymer transport system component
VTGTGIDIFVMQADGSGVTQLTLETSLNAYAPSWSPDSAKIAFVKQGSAAAMTGGSVS